MGTTDWATIRPLLSRPFGIVVVTLTTALTTSKVALSTQLAEDYAADDYFVNWYIKIRNFANAGQARRVTAYSAASGQLTLAGANFGSDSANKATIELHRFHPDRMLEHFNDATRDLFPLVSVLRDSHVVVTGQDQHFYALPTTVERRPLQVWTGRRPLAEAVRQNEVVDPGFEEWTDDTTPAQWTLTGSGSTVNRERASSPSNYQVLEGGSSARVDVDVTTLTTLLQTVTPTVGVEGVEANFSIWVYCLTSGRVTAEVGSSSGDVHTGTGWELLTVTEGQGTTDTTVTVGISVTSGDAITIYVDEAILIMGQSEGIDGGWDVLMNWRYLPQVASVSSGSLVTAPRLYVRGSLREKHRLRVVYQAALNVLVVDTDTVEIDGEVLQVVLAKTRANMSTEAAGDAPIAAKAFWIESAGRFDRIADGFLARGIGSPAVPMTPRIPDMGG